MKLNRYACIEPFRLGVLIWVLFTCHPPSFLPCRAAPATGVWLLIHTRGCHLTRAHSSISSRPGNIMKSLAKTQNGVWIRYRRLTHTVLYVKGHQKASGNPHDKLVGVEEEEREWHIWWEWEYFRSRCWSNVAGVQPGNMSGTHVGNMLGTQPTYGGGGLGREPSVHTAKVRTTPNALVIKSRSWAQSRVAGPGDSFNDFPPGPGSSGLRTSVCGLDLPPNFLCLLVSACADWGLDSTHVPPIYSFLLLYFSSLCVQLVYERHHTQLYLQ
jgi:hypothetical protein